MASDAFANLASLHSLQLNHNDLAGELDPRALRPLAGLSTLGLGHNRIERVAPDTFKGCTQVSVMSFLLNDISGWEKGFVSGFLRVKQI